MNKEREGTILVHLGLLSMAGAVYLEWGWPAFLAALSIYLILFGASQQMDDEEGEPEQQDPGIGVAMEGTDD